MSFIGDVCREALEDTLVALDEAAELLGGECPEATRRMQQARSRAEEAIQRLDGAGL